MYLAPQGWQILKPWQVSDKPAKASAMGCDTLDTDTIPCNCFGKFVTNL